MLPVKNNIKMQKCQLSPWSTTDCYETTVHRCLDFAEPFSEMSEGACSLLNVACDVPLFSSNEIKYG
jgi:hypothetical protein